VGENPNKLVNLVSKSSVIFLVNSWKSKIAGDFKRLVHIVWCSTRVGPGMVARNLLSDPLTTLVRLDADPGA